MLNPFIRLVNLYWRFLVSPEKYALHIGVKIGKNCFIATREWSSEPYLISIGNNCQITKTSIYTRMVEVKQYAIFVLSLIHTEK